MRPLPVQLLHPLDQRRETDSNSLKMRSKNRRGEIEERERDRTSNRSRQSFIYTNTSVCISMQLVLLIPFKQTTPMIPMHMHLHYFQIEREPHPYLISIIKQLCFLFFCNLCMFWFSKAGKKGRNQGEGGGVIYREESVGWCCIEIEEEKDLG